MNISSPSHFIGINTKDYISFGSGQPDLPPPQSMFNAIRGFREYKYGAIAGELPLREKLATYHSRRDIDADRFIITNGSSEAIDMALRTQLRPGDRVLLLRPYYYSYPHYIRINHGLPIHCPIRDGTVDMGEFQHIVTTQKPRVFMLNSPSNPSGSVLSPQVIKQMSRICSENNVTIISDEVYSRLVYDGKHYSPKGEHVININSFSKTFSMCGFRVGYAYSQNPDLIQDMIEAKTHTSMNTSLISQQAALGALESPDSYIRKQFRIWKDRRNYIYEELTKLGLSLSTPKGAFYVLPQVKNPSQLMSTLFTRHKTIVYNGEWFGAPGTIRLSYALDKEKIEAGIGCLRTCLSQGI